MSEETRAAPSGPVPGARIAGYVLEEQIGQGGMAMVFRARDERLGRQVALKILSPSLAADEAFRRRFIRESRAAAAVDDPHIIPVFEAGEADGMPFIAMRYVRGGDVGSLAARQGQLPPVRVAEIVSQAASALDAAHRQGLVHRDVKPSNMLLDAESGPDHVYLSDFGLSKAVFGATTLTGTGQFLGTLEYVSPEQIEGKPVDGRADQYALACAAFQLLCGSPPFRGDDIGAVLGGHLHRPPPPVTSLRPGLPAAVEAAFERALAKNPAQRYPTCGEFADALRRALADQPPEPPPIRRKWRRAVIAAVVPVCAAIGLLAWALWPSPPPSPVLAPAGLRAGSLTTGSVMFSWSGPASGPAPDRYVIWQDSVAIGSVGGTDLSYQARGLAPDTTYRYQVQAIMGSRHSARSAVLVASTLTPPVSAARLSGAWTLRFRVVTASSIDGFFHPAGRSWITRWVFSPDCSAGACAVAVSGNIIFDHGFAATLSRAGAAYTASIHLKNLEYCDYANAGARYPIDDEITLRITVSAAHAVSNVWTAAAWAGTFTINSPYTPIPPTGGVSYCPAYTVQADVSGVS